MNVFRLHQGYRDIGPNYGLPTFYVDVGIGVNYDPLEVIKRLGTMGLRKSGWVTIRNNPVGEKGCGVLVSGLKAVGCKVEVEDEGLNGTPGWYPQVDRWIIHYREGSKFNYGALRPRQDLLIYKGEDIVGFLTKTKDVQGLRAVVVKDRNEVWNLVKDMEVRVYEDNTR